LTIESTTVKTVQRFMGGKLMFGRFKRLYFIGIGGAGMSGIAEILHNLGYQVTGSDSTPSEITEYLESKGVTIYPSHVGSNVKDIDVVVISSAINEKNPEVIEARRLRIPVIKRAEMLGELMRLKFSIGIAGTHGKTTTTSMIGRILQQANLKPTLIVGGVVAELGTGASLGEGDYLVAEADEYDKSFLSMFPSMAVVLNVEPDHLECYDGVEDLKNSFLTYINRVPFYGSAIISADDPNTAQFRDRITRPFATFGFAPTADYRAVDIQLSAGRTTFAVYYHQDLLGEIILRVPGRHNVSNALAGIATARELDVPFVAIADALRTFRGVGRRFELIGEANDILVFDDYAHHPTEIAATLKAARDCYPDRRIIVVFQPHLFSRTKYFVREFAEALSHADLCILTDIYPARELPIEGVTSDRIREEAERLGNKNFRYVGVKENAVDAVLSIAKPKDLIITQGAGSITHIKKTILERLKKA
jgi:UDP-N-acetylmuramate--alanine ligase